MSWLKRTGMILTRSRNGGHFATPFKSFLTQNAERRPKTGQKDWNKVTDRRPLTLIDLI